MANFNTHFVVASGASAVVSGTMLSMEVIAPTESVMAFALGTFGGLMPDIDSDHSKSIGIGFTVLSLLITILSVFLKSSTYSIIEMLIMAGVVFWAVRFGLIGVFRKISKHRGMFHSIPVAFIWGVVTAIVMHLFLGLDALLSWVYGIMITWGYMVHLILDEIYSVDLRNRRVKKSSGTALKFFKLKTQTDKIQNGLIYLSLFLLISVAPDSSLVQEALFSSDAFKNFMDVLLPYDGKWFFH
ncbi:metal-dependent hydrolase [Sulfurovum sp. bin170]|uniref:metal-dependent hydrolase n=1 Tax=Sulfurovum sp. bin170 TaxID=2695268 RepID=UPI002105E267|nr:metal-dependent hydrolase [Sulfurovum sp. bin170]